jgi:DNA-binding transcriptional MerR regulator
MRISELSRHSNVPTSTIKFYIRDGLLPPGERSHRNQAQYGEDHLRRLDLIRALRDVAGLSLDVVRAVLEQFERSSPDADPVGPALEVIFRAPERDRNQAEQAELDTVRSEVSALMEQVDWVLPQPDSGRHYLNIDSIADAVVQLRKYIEPDLEVDQLRRYAQAAWLFSEAVYESFEDRVPRPGDDLIDPTRIAVLGTLLVEPLVSAWVRTALVMRSMHIGDDIPLPKPRLPRKI